MAVTGGAGFIGSHVVDALIGRGARVLTLDNFCDAYPRALKLENIAGHRGHPRHELAEVDIREAAALTEALAGFAPDTVVHLAARPGVRRSIAEPGRYQETNVGGTVNVLEAARALGVEAVVFGSSSSVYGDRGPVALTEQLPLDRPASPYAASKIGAEAQCRAFAAVHGLRVTCLRMFSVYGPRMRPDLAIRIFAERILRGEPIQVFGDGASRRDYTFIEDIVDGIAAAASHRAGPPLSVFNLGAGRAIELRALISGLERALGVRAVLKHMPDQPGDVSATLADNTRARAALGFDPTTGIEAGLARLAAWLRGRLAA
ncbi:MAG: NAD-dependent epimerase/dehydratase family protein [Myxococcales bacterium]|nr:NAD-dependent epimerase/dehydratase family protein [Myxococcales bacterium]